MKISSYRVAAFIAGIPLSVLISNTLGAPDVPEELGCEQCVSIQVQNEQNEQSLEQIAEALLTVLPADERDVIVAKRGIGSEGYDPDAQLNGGTLPEGMTLVQWAQGMIEELGEHSMTKKQVEAIYNIARTIDEGITVPPICYSAGTNSDYIRIVDQMLYGFNPLAFHQFDRWPRTATNGPGLEQGDPTVLTYSFVNDGTFIPNIGFGAGNSQLFAWLNSVYGTPAVWQDLFAQVFARWAELTGTSYVFEPNDDGVSLSSSFGIVGVRGDVRIAAMVLDGNFGVLAFNMFPDDGDMVFDAFDSFFNDTSDNSLRFRNVTAHEHGHGLGMAHVCPISSLPTSPPNTEKKLMEPYVSEAFDGPQLDDILNGHRHYGDPLEPNDDNTEATDLGFLSVGQDIIFDNVSIDDPDDVDFFKVTLTSSSLITFTVTPDAREYKNGYQDFGSGEPEEAYCVDGQDENYNRIHDLMINVYDSDDFVNPIQFSETQFLGFPEVMVFPALEAREYWFEIVGLSSNENVQRYDVNINAGFLLSIHGDFPVHLDPGVENSFSVEINPFDQSIEAGSELIFYRSEPGEYTSLPLVPNKGIDYTATLPGFDCDPDGEIEYYIQATLAGSGSITTFPPEGGSDPLSALVGTPSPFFADTFESDLGWTIAGDIVGQNAGQWERGVPAGDGSRGDPPTDGDGSGSCYITGNGGPGSNTDVDIGETILVSQVFDLSDVVRPSVSYWRWYDNTGSGLGSGASEDVFRVEITDGRIDPVEMELIWLPLETIGPDTLDSKGGWFFADLDLAYALDGHHDFIFDTTQMQIRFIAEDLVNPSVIEAGVDGVKVSELLCQDRHPVISLAAEPASDMPPGEDYSFEVLIDEPFDQVVPGSESLFFLTTAAEVQRGGFIEVPLVSNGGNSYTATIPAQNCNPNHHTLPDGAGDVSYFLQVEGVTTGITTFPDTETEDLLGINIGIPMLVLHDNFELDTGWAVSGGPKSPSDGMWVRGIPIGDGASGDPATDGDGSGQCFVTGNAAGGADSDVDGLTMLTSPVFDILDLLEPRVEFYRWYDNTGAGGGASPGNDVMEVGISYDGGAFYETLDSIGPNTADSVGGWIQSVLELDAFGPGTSTMRIRFLVSDRGSDSVIEAGIDGVRIAGRGCEDVLVCSADLNNDGELDFFDVSLFLIAFGNGDPVADFDDNGEFDFFDVSAFLIAFSAGCP